MTNERGPHYGTSREDAIRKGKLFFDLAKNRNASLIIFPEYSAPRELLFALCSQPDRLLTGSFIVLPLEALSIQEYEQVVTSINGMDRCQCDHLDVATQPTGGFVNLCSIIAITESAVKVYFQPKRWASILEESRLCIGSDFYCFRGSGISLTVMICADGNQPDTYEDQIRTTMEAARGSYFIHTQWNPEPRYPIYEDLWRRIISSDRAGSNLLMSVNVASGSLAGGQPTTRVKVPYDSIACSGNGQPDKKYMSPRNLIAFKSLLEQKRYGQVLNFIFPYDCAHIATVKRPFENPSHAVNMTDTLLHDSRTFFFSSEYNELDGKYANESIKKLLEEKKIAIPEDCFAQFTPEEIEIFIASCLLQEKYKWLEHDILSRPLIWLSFYHDIIENQDAEDSVDYFSQCLDRMKTCEGQGYEPLPASTIRQYPINLKHKEDNSIAWLFHCRGLSADRIEAKVRDLLVRYVQKATKSRLRLFPIDSSGDLRIDKIQMSSLSVIDGELLLKRRGMINDPVAKLDIEVAKL
jgi:predicted amidohydrolase